MAKEYIIGVDIGTQGTKAALFSEGGKCLSSAFRKSKLYRQKNNVVEEDPEQQLLTVCQTIKQCVKTAKINPYSVAAVGFDGQMAGIIGIGEDGIAITPYDSWLDTRCTAYIKMMEDEAGDEVLAKTGNAPSFNHGPKKLWWMHERPKIFKRIKAFVQPGGYVAMRLCGLNARQAFIDNTYLHFSGFARNKQNCWNIGLCNKFRLDPSKLPRIVEPHNIVGEFIPSMARRCGLSSGVPVVAGCGDTAASFLACGATKEGVCVDVAGTASVFAATTKTFKADMKHRTLGCGHAATPGLWHPYAYINGGGMNLEWFRREIADHGKADSKTSLTFEQLNKIASEIPLEDFCPLFIPHLAGRVCPSEPNLRGAWCDLNWSHTLGHMYRAMLEGIAFEYGIYRNVLKKLYPRLALKEVRVTGGGEKSVFWNRIKSAVLETPIVRMINNYGAPMGVAMVAGFGAGMFKSLPQVAERWIQRSNPLIPNQKMANFYKMRIKKYEKLIDCLNEFNESTGD